MHAAPACPLLKNQSISCVPAHKEVDQITLFRSRQVAAHGASHALRTVRQRSLGYNFTLTWHTTTVLLESP
jgi:hypothetical protein